MVEKEDVNEAMRLMEMSKDSLNPAHDMHSRYSSVHFFVCLTQKRSQINSGRNYKNTNLSYLPCELWADQQKKYGRSLELQYVKKKHTFIVTHMLTETGLY